MFARPGELANAEKTCGRCHTRHVQAVRNSRMHTGAGIVSKTRQRLEPQQAHEDPASFQTLGHSLADSLLRKLCASCHLGQDSNRQIDAVQRRGGGCLACHLENTESGHARISARVSDANCFGCHSRSGRISLNYAGLAEVDDSNLAEHSTGHARLSDGRLVHKQSADVHHQAGMSCIDCHTGSGLMNLEQHNGGVDIACNDCHANRQARLTPQTWPAQYRSMLKRIPFEVPADSVFLQTQNGTPLWHIEVRDGQPLLHPKLGGQEIPIPQLAEQHIPLPGEHQRLNCDSCHATWAPLCLGCHMQYDKNRPQWDHQSQAVMPGHWREQRWDLDAGAPVLGLLDQHRIGVFIPGMIMSLDHPSLGETKFLRNFAAISPHTTGAARSCEACHASAWVLGLGGGRLTQGPEGMVFEPEQTSLPDGLPADAWTNLDSKNAAETSNYPRPFNRQEIEKIVRALTSAKIP
ncbi:MAG: hypothetical protein PVG66_09015 [Chromatiales bacterium]